MHYSSATDTAKVLRPIVYRNRFRYKKSACGERLPGSAIFRYSYKPTFAGITIGSMSYLRDNARTGRVILPDLVRAFALFGIALVNVAYFAYPGDVTYHAGGLNSGRDSSAYFLVNALFLFKSYTLFSFMFGVGLSHQMIAAERRGQPFAASYSRRMCGLIVLGILHVTLAFLGDILIIYGVLGLILFLFRNSSQKTLIRTGIAMAVIQVLVGTIFTLGTYALETQSPGEYAVLITEMDSQRATNFAIYTNDNFTDIAHQRWRDWIGMIVFAAPLQAPGAFGFFLFGLAAARAGVLADPKAVLWRRSRKVFLPIGVTLSLAGTYIYSTSPGPISSGGLLGVTLLLLAAPFSSLGYIGFIAKWAEMPVTKLRTTVARAGTLSLTAYLLQSLILSLVFCGYGLGLFGELGAFACISVALFVALFSIAFSSIWRMKFDRGPTRRMD